MLFFLRGRRRACPFPPLARPIASGTTNGIVWLNAHADAPRPSRENGTTLTFLGTGSGALASRNSRGLSGAVLNSHDRHASFVFDVGDGTARAYASSRAANWSWLVAGGIFISHLHGDHVFGLPSLVTAALHAARTAADATGGGGRESSHARGGDADEGGGLSQRSSASAPALRIFGPPGTHRLLSAALGATHSDAALSRAALEVFEFMDDRAGGSAAAGPPVGPPPTPPDGRSRDGTAALTATSAVRLSRAGRGIAHFAIYPDANGVYPCLQSDWMSVRAAPLRHSAPCFGYVYQENDVQHLNADAVRRAGGRLDMHTRTWLSELKAGRTITLPNGVVLRPADVLVQGTRGRKVAVFSDMSSASEAAIALAQRADLLVHEATLAPGECAAAAARAHSSPDMAGRVAARINARALVLTHFGRKSLDYEHASSIWALGLPEANAELKRREDAGIAERAGARTRAWTAWAHLHGAAGGVFEPPALLTPDHTRPVMLDLAYPPVEETRGSTHVSIAAHGVERTYVPGPADWVRAAETAFAAEKGAAAGKAPPLPVLCARDFMTVVIQPPRETALWGASGPIKSNRKN